MKCLGPAACVLALSSCIAPNDEPVKPELPEASGRSASQTLEPGTASEQIEAIPPELTRGRITAACTPGQQGALWIEQQNDRCVATLAGDKRTLRWTWRIGSEGLLHSELLADQQLMAHFVNEVPLAGQTLTTLAELELVMQAALDASAGDAS